MSFHPDGGFSITTNKKTYMHIHGLSPETLNKILKLLGKDLAARKKKLGKRVNPEAAKLDSKEVRSVSLFAPPSRRSK